MNIVHEDGSFRVEQVSEKTFLVHAEKIIIAVNSLEKAKKEIEELKKIMKGK
jgi:hypothetical protein